MTRERWSDIAPRWQTAHVRAHAGRLTAHQHAVLEAVLYLLASFQQTEDNLSLGQIAQHAGIWPKPADECPKTTRLSVGRHLRALADVGAITYQPAKGRGYSGTVGLPDADPTIAARFQKASHRARPSSANSSHEPRPSDQKASHEPDPSDQEGRGSRATRARSTPAKGRARPPQKGAPQARPPEGRDPEGFPEGSLPEDGGAAHAEPPASAAPHSPHANGGAPSDSYHDPLGDWLCDQGRYDLTDPDVDDVVSRLTLATLKLPMNLRRDVATELALHPTRYRRPDDIWPVVLDVARTAGIHLDPTLPELPENP